MPKKFMVGCSGWYYDDWVNRFYPEEISKKEWLGFYSEHFKTVEVNNTFYHYPNQKMLEGWYNRTPDDFKLTLKANRLITHRKKFEETQDQVDRFYELAEHLEDKLACILFQLPPSKSKNLDFLKNALDQLDPEKQNVIEFRHTSWFDEEVYDILRDYNVGFCIVSHHEMPDDLAVTSDIAYVRFHGKEEGYRYLYSEDEMSDWAERIKSLEAESGFCYFNNDFQAHAIENGEQLRQQF